MHFKKWIRAKQYDHKGIYVNKKSTIYLLSTFENLVLVSLAIS